MKLSLGVLDQAYDDTGITTGDIAEILEDKYEVMGGFWDMHGQEVADDMASGFAAELEDILSGKPAELALPFEGAMEKTQDRFRKFLDNKELDGRRPGIPTKASLKGTSPRFKKRGERKSGGPATLNPGRPSFEFSGQYYASFKAWVKA